jgi:hypothetical protein
LRIFLYGAGSPLRLGFSSFVDHDLYEMVCSVHTALYPTREIKSQGRDNVELLTLLDKGKIDAALLTLPVSEAGLKTYPFTHSRLVVCMRADDPLSKLKEITPADLGSKLTIFREPKQHPEAHDRLIEMLNEVGITGDVASTNKTPHELQWMVESSYSYALIPEGSALQKGLVTRPIAGVTWTVDSALVLGRSKPHRTLPQLIKELRRRFRLQSKLPPAKPVRSPTPHTNQHQLLPMQPALPSVSTPPEERGSVLSATPIAVAPIHADACDSCTDSLPITHAAHRTPPASGRSAHTPSLAARPLLRSGDDVFPLRLLRSSPQSITAFTPAKEWVCSDAYVLTAKAAVS